MKRVDFCVRCLVFTAVYSGGERGLLKSGDGLIDFIMKWKFWQLFDVRDSKSSATLLIEPKRLFYKSDGRNLNVKDQSSLRLVQSPH